MMSREFRTVSTPCRVDHVRGTTQITLEWSARVTARNSKKRIQSSSSLLFGFKFVLWGLKSKWLSLSFTLTCSPSFQVFWWSLSKIAASHLSLKCHDWTKIITLDWDVSMYKPILLTSSICSLVWDGGLGRCQVTGILVSCDEKILFTVNPRHQWPVYLKFKRSF